MGTQVVVSKKMNEESLILAGQRGEAQALNTLFCRYHKSLFHSALRVMGNAEDALQDGLLAVYLGLKSFEGRSQFSPWLTRNRNKRRSHASPLFGSSSNNGSSRTPRSE